MGKSPKTLQEAILHFSDFENCKAFMVTLRWPDGKIVCPRCGGNDVAYLPNARVFKCYAKHAQQKFSLKVGTIFEDSPIPLEKWLPVMWMLVNCKNGVSSWEIHRAMGVTQKTAWFMLQRGRLAMQDDLTGGSLGGQVEVDESYIGGSVRNMHKARKNRVQRGGRDGGKTVVMGMLERGKRVRAYRHS
jgi:transposase-like protein